MFGETEQFSTFFSDFQNMIFCVQIITMKFCEEKSEQASSYFYFNIITGAQHDFVCVCGQ